MDLAVHVLVHQIKMSTVSTFYQKEIEIRSGGKKISVLIGGCTPLFVSLCGTKVGDHDGDLVAVSTGGSVSGSVSSGSQLVAFPFS